MKKFIVIEGLDGSGKSTQLKLLQDYLVSKNISFKFLHFPRLNQGIFGTMIAKFLRGEFGALEDVHPYLTALLYAGDRKDAADTVRQWLDDDELVIVDRYVYSNIAYQCAKLDDDKEIKKLEDWINTLEYQYYQIPKPAASVFLHVPFRFVEQKLSGQRAGEDRDYLNGKEDIHESNMSFQKKVAEQYLRIFENDQAGHVISCMNEKKEMLPVTTIHKQIITCLQEIKII